MARGNEQGFGQGRILSIHSFKKLQASASRTDYALVSDRAVALRQAREIREESGSTGTKNINLNHPPPTKSP